MLAACVLVNLILNIIKIPQFSYIGAALASAIMGKYSSKKRAFESLG